MIFGCFFSGFGLNALGMVIARVRFWCNLLTAAWPFIQRFCNLTFACICVVHLKLLKKTGHKAPSLTF